MLPHEFYNMARLVARFHIQLRIDNIDAIAQTPSFVPVSATVVRMFRTDSSLQLGERIGFEVGVSRPGDENSCGGVRSQPFDALIITRYAEVFLNGTPPDCEAALSQFMLPAESTGAPNMNPWYPWVAIRHRYPRGWFRWFG